MANVMITGSEQEVVPTCGVCGRKLGVGFYFSCHVCGATYCYAHAPQKCSHANAKRPLPKATLTR